MKNTASGGMQKTKSGIDWQDYNWPPMLRIVHFSLDELPDGSRKVVLKIYISFIIAFITCIINIISNIAQVADADASALNILYTFLNFVLIVCASAFVFYQGYKSIAQCPPRDDDEFNKYLLGQAALFVAYVVFSIISAGAFNGWTKSGDVSDCGFCTAMVYIEATLYTLNYILAGFCLFLTWKFEPESNRSLGPRA